MSKDVSIEIENLAEVKASFKKYGKDATKAVMNAVNRTGLSIESDAKRRLRGLLGSAKHWITGRLASSVHMETKKENTFNPIKDSKTKDGSLGVKIGELEAVVGTNVEYADKIEFDYDSFIRFAAERNEPKFQKTMEDELNKLNR